MKGFPLIFSIVYYPTSICMGKQYPSLGKPIYLTANCFLSKVLTYLSYNNITIKYTNTYRPAIKCKCHWVDLSPESASKRYVVRIECCGCSYTTECTVIGILWSGNKILNF